MGRRAGTARTLLAAVQACQNGAVQIQDWWPRVDEPTRQWLRDNNGDVVPPDVLARITAVAGDDTAGAPWAGGSGPDGFLLSDEAVDWIEEAANDEQRPV